MLVFWPIGYMVGRKGKTASMKIQKERDERANLMMQVLDSVRLLKSFQWEDFAEEMVENARKKEVRAQMQRQACFGANGVFSQIAQVMGPLCAFGFYILYQKELLTAATAFTSLAWFNILKRPLTILPNAFTSVLDCMVSMERLERFFLSEETPPPSPAL